MMEIHRYCGFFLTGIHRPVLSTVLNAVRVLALLIPLSFAGDHYFGITGIFSGRLITDLVSGTLGLMWVTWILNARKQGVDRTINNTVHS